jgi:glycerol kinase
VIETTALGAAYLAGLTAGIYQSPQELAQHWRVERRFEPRMTRDEAQSLIAHWDKAVRQTVAA